MPFSFCMVSAKDRQSLEEQGAGQPGGHVSPRGQRGSQVGGEAGGAGAARQAHTHRLSALRPWAVLPRPAPAPLSPPSREAPHPTTLSHSVHAGLSCLSVPTASLYGDCWGPRVRPHLGGKGVLSAAQRALVGPSPDTCQRQALALFSCVHSLSPRVGSFDSSW